MKIRGQAGKCIRLLTQWYELVLYCSTWLPRWSKGNVRLMDVWHRKPSLTFSFCLQLDILNWKPGWESGQFPGGRLHIDHAARPPEVPCHLPCECSHQLWTKTERKMTSPIFKTASGVSWWSGCFPWTNYCSPRPASNSKPRKCFLITVCLKVLT